MDQSFAEKFKSICAEINNVIPKMVEKVKPLERMYNVHKRSLPVCIDKKIVLNVTKAHGTMLLDKFCKTRMFQDDTKDSKTIIYFDLVPVDASPAERSIYFNSGDIQSL